MQQRKSTIYQAKKKVRYRSPGLCPLLSNTQDCAYFLYRSIEKCPRALLSKSLASCASSSRWALALCATAAPSAATPTTKMAALARIRTNGGCHSDAHGENALGGEMEDSGLGGSKGGTLRSRGSEWRDSHNNRAGSCPQGESGPNRGTFSEDIGLVYNGDSETKISRINPAQKFWGNGLTAALNDRTSELTNHKICKRWVRRGCKCISPRLAP